MTNKKIELIKKTTDMIEAMKDKKAGLIEGWSVRFRFALMEKAGLEYYRKTQDMEFPLYCIKRVEDALKENE